jgi:hypothetical protein
MITQAIYETQRAGEHPDFGNVCERLDAETIAFAERIMDWIDTGPLPEGVVPAGGEERLAGILAQFDRRSLQTRLDDLRRALAEIDPNEDLETHESLRMEIRRLMARGLPPLGSTFTNTL